jgi:hypothetical protein
MKYAEMLRSAGVKVADITSMGMPHGFYESGFGEVFEGENDYLGEEVIRMIMDGTISKKSQECLEFIKKNRRGTYTSLLTEGRLNEYLHAIDEQAHEQLDLHINQMAKRMGVTEELKATDPMRWVQMMNNIKASAEEIVLKEVVYK